MCNMSKFPKILSRIAYEISDKLDICSSSSRSRSAPFSINATCRVDASFNKIAKRTSASISCWKLTHHLNSTITLL